MTRPDDDHERQRGASDPRDGQEASTDGSGASASSAGDQTGEIITVPSSMHSVRIQALRKPTAQMIRVRSSNPTKARA